MHSYYSTFRFQQILRLIAAGFFIAAFLPEAIEAKPAYPVIFIHGFKSDAGAWADLGNKLVSGGLQFGGFPEVDESTGAVSRVFPGDFYIMNFSDHADPAFKTQRLYLVQRAYEVGLVIKAVLEANPGYTKVILVGHSLGGLAARAYLQDHGFSSPTGGFHVPYNYDVAELITVGSPHLGAGIASVCQAVGVGDLCIQQGINPDSVSLDEMRPNSQVILELRDLIDFPLPAGVKYHSIVGVGRWVLGTFEDGDGIVSAVSQDLGSLDPHIANPSEQIVVIDSSSCDLGLRQSHTCETLDYGVQNAIVLQINMIAGPPVVTTSAATNITQQSASLYMQVTPNHSSTSIWFDWGKTTSLGSQTVQKGVGTGATSITASVTLGGLECGTTYYFRARAQNSINTAVPGQILSFSTASCSTGGGGGENSISLLTNGDFEQGSLGWTVLSGDWHISPPSPVTPHSGTHAIYLSTATGGMGNNLAGRFYTPPLNVPSNATSGQYAFWLNVITTEPSSAAGVDLLHFTVVDASTFTPIVSSWISNQNNTGGSYTFVPFLMDNSLPGRSVRLVFDGTTNQANPTLFALDDISFTVNMPTTTAGAPYVSTQDSDDVTPSSARVSMAVNPNGADTTVWFNFEAENPSPVTETDHISIGADQQSVNFSFEVFGLQCDTVYYYRANAINSYGSRQGLIFSFRTDTCPAQPPAARTNPADTVTSSSARLNGAVNPNGSSTAAWFVWGTDTISTNRTPTQDITTGNSSVSIAATINNLQCGTTYYYRAVAQNSGGSDTGALYNFTTSSCGPPPNVPPTISITAPGASNATADQSFTIAWNDSDPDNNATITLSYSLHGDCSSPVQIVSNISEDDPANSYTWNTSSLPVDGYYILATISDGVNPLVSSCSSGHVSVSHVTNQNQIFKDGFETGDLSAWASTPPSSLIVYQLTQGQPGQPGKDIWTTSVYSYTGTGGGPGGGLDNEKLLTGGWGDLYYSLIEFNIAGLPSHAYSVRLELFSVETRDVPTTQLYLDRITQFWDWRTQGTGSDRNRLWWADRPSTVPWRVDALPAPTVGQWYSIDITDLYNGWQDGSIPNYGLQLRPVTNNNTWSEFSSSNCADPVFKPRLVIQTVHPLVGMWQGTIAGYASTLTIAQDSSGQFSAQAFIAQANQPVESLTIVSVTETSFDALRPADHNAELRLSLNQSGGQQCLAGDYLDNGTTRPVSLCKTQ